jgi:hypothetical protein
MVATPATVVIGLLWLPVSPSRCPLPPNATPVNITANHSRSAQAVHQEQPIRQRRATTRCQQTCPRRPYAPSLGH